MRHHSESIAKAIQANALPGKPNVDQPLLSVSYERWHIFVQFLSRGIENYFIEFYAITKLILEAIMN